MPREDILKLVFNAIDILLHSVLSHLMRLPLIFKQACNEGLLITLRSVQLRYLTVIQVLLALLGSNAPRAEGTQTALKLEVIIYY